MAKDFTAISTEYLAGIDQEIERLQTLRMQVASLLGTAPQKTRNPGRPAAAKRTRTLSSEARERIAAAQRKRWAQQKRAGKPAKKAPAKTAKKAAANKSTAKKTAATPEATA